ncbi:hypothetical protein KY346_00150 [Candidatus Woesearchaeota archaeon]|nr:hypothetical protein [Candidatus Woesearchaeota archaeon]
MADLQRKLSIEDAMSAITEVVSTAEDLFNARYNRLPSLDQRDDLIGLSDFLDAYSFGESTWHSEGYGIKDTDVTYVLLRRFLERKGFFDGLGVEQSKIFDGFMGRLAFNPPKREYQFRLNAIDYVKERIEFPEDFRVFTQNIAKIDKTVRSLPDGQVMMRIGPLCHVTASLCTLMHNKSVSFDTFAERWKEIIASLEQRDGYGAYS